jgi:hypothetical protein
MTIHHAFITTEDDYYAKYKRVGKSWNALVRYALDELDKGEKNVIDNGKREKVESPARCGNPEDSGSNQKRQSQDESSKSSGEDNAQGAVRRTTRAAQYR